MSDIDRLTEALVGRYVIDREIGAGGMATVYLAHDVRHNRKVAVKVLRPELAAVVGGKRFLQEIEVTANLQHPHIVPLFESGEADGFLFYVMPFVEGVSLRVRLAQEGVLSITEAVRILTQVADAIAYAHSRGVVHRDIKPDNVMLSGRHATVTDFGIARAVSEAAGNEGLTTAGMAVGTPAYMAPEQAAADPNVDHRADIYALGVLGYEMLAGAPPFTGSPQQVLAAHLTGRPEPLSKHRPEVPPALVQVVTRALAREPADRWEKSEDVLHQLEALQTPGSGTVAVRAVSPKRRRLLVGVFAAVAVTLGALGLIQRSSQSEAEVSSKAIAVFPFSVRGGPDVQYLGEGMVNLLATSMDGAGELRSVDPRAVMALVQQERVQAITPEQAAGLAQELGAGLYIRGDIVQLGDRIRIDAALYDQGRGSQPVGTGTADGALADVLGMVDQVATQLLGAEAAGPGSRVTQVAAVTTSSLPALKAYLEGESDFRAGRFTAAVESFQTAVATDSQFALAFYRLSIAAEWAFRPDLANLAAEGAVRHADRLSNHDRRLLEALLADRRGDDEQAERMFRAIVEIWPQDVEAWMRLAEVQFHYGPLRGRPLAASRDEFERVLGFEPDNVPALIHLQRIAARTADVAAVDSFARRILELNPEGDRALEVQAHPAALSDDPAKLAAFRAKLDAAPEIHVPGAIWGVVSWSPRLTAGRVVLETETLPQRSAELRALGHVHLAYHNAIQGRWIAAQAELAAVESLNPALGLTHRAFLVLQPFIPASRSDVEAILDQLSRWETGRVPPSSIPNVHFNIHDGEYPAIRRYLMGMAHVELGSLAEALAIAGELERAGGGGADAVLMRAYTRSLRTAVADARGDQPAALRVLGDAPIPVNYELALFSPLVSMVADRFRRATLLQALGRNAEAEQTYRSFEEFSFFDRVFAAPAALRAGRLAERDGRRSDASRHYQRFVSLWSGADAEFQPLLDEARAALQRLGGRAEGE